MKFRFQCAQVQFSQGPARLTCWCIIYGCFHYSREVELSQQRPCGLQSSKYQLLVYRKSLTTRGSVAVMLTACGANQASRLLRITLRTGVWGWSGGVFSLPRVWEAAAKMNGGGWLGQYCSNVEAEPSAGDAGDREKSEIMFLFRLPASTHPRPPLQTHIITIVFFLIPTYKHISGQDVNKYNCLCQTSHTFSGKTK